jgi:putative membrane protein insertion efficiency factor
MAAQQSAPDPDAGYREVTLAEYARVRRPLPERIVIGLIRFYQLVISPGLPPSCRFYPSCSEYTLQAVAKYGVLKGLWLGIRRIVRCHPFHPGGYDPVP